MKCADGLCRNEPLRQNAGLNILRKIYEAFLHSSAEMGCNWHIVPIIIEFSRVGRSYTPK